MKISEVESILSCHVDENFTPVACCLAPRTPALELKLLVLHAALISWFENEMENFPEHAPCCCKHLPKGRFSLFLTIIGLPPHYFPSLQPLPTLVVFLSLSCLRYLAFFELILSALTGFYSR